MLNTCRLDQILEWNCSELDRVLFREVAKNGHIYFSTAASDVEPEGKTLAVARGLLPVTRDGLPRPFRDLLHAGPAHGLRGFERKLGTLNGIANLKNTVEYQGSARQLMPTL